jgi:hypothetical protein
VKEESHFQASFSKTWSCGVMNRTCKNAGMKGT